MKRPTPTMIIIFILLLGLPLYTGCAGMEINRKVDDYNVLHSSAQPKISLRINSDLQYMEKSDDHQRGFSSSGGEQSTGIDVDEFTFLSRDRHAVVKFSKLASERWYFEANIFPQKNKFSEGTVTIHGVTYKHAVFAISQKKGYLLVRAVGKRVGANNNAKFEVYYVKGVAGDWSDPARLTMQQKKQIEDLHADFERDIEFLK